MKKINLLMVEDDPMVMAVHEEFIERIGGFAIVGKARTGSRALEMINNLQPHLVILDIYLPDMDGIRILKEIRRLEIPTDVIMITAAQDVEIVQDTLRLGVVDYIIKPFRFQRIKAALDKYKIYTNKFKHQGPIAQEELDNIINLGAGVEKEREQEIPKGLREITMHQVYNFLAQSGQGLSAEEVAEGIGLARVTARRYLDYLEKTGRVLLESTYGSVGRPVNKYRAGT